MSNIDKEKMLGYYAYSYLALSDENYRSAINGFNYTLRNKIEIDKSAIGLICAYACTGRYRKALKIYSSCKDAIIFNSRLRHQLVRDLSYFLAKDTSALKFKRRNYFSSVALSFHMNRTYEIYEADNSNIPAIILMSYWHINTGHIFENQEKFLNMCVYFRTLDNVFRWKLLSRIAVNNKDLWEDESLAAMFTEIPEEVTSSEYINTLILSILYNKDLEKSRNNIEIYRNKGHIFTNDVMWNFICLSVEEDEIDDLTVNFAKHLISEGWVDSIIAEVIRFGYANRSRYSVAKELKKLAFFNL